MLRQRRLVRWMCTQWCNYSCWYCRQDHCRKQEYRGGAGHWEDAGDVSECCLGFYNSISNSLLSLVITGGEPMLGAMDQLLPKLLRQSWVDGVRVDTNGSWAGGHKHQPH